MRKFWIVALVGLLLLAFAFPGQAANTVTRFKNIVEIQPDGSTDWDSASLGLTKVVSIEFWASATTDMLVVRNGSATGPAMMRVKDTSIIYFDDKMFPYIKAADCTFSTPANARIIVHFR